MSGDTGAPTDPLDNPEAPQREPALTASEQEIWRGWITATRRLYTQLGVEMQAEFGLSMGDYEILMRLSESPEHRLRMSELATLTLSSRSRLSHQIDRLERDGFVRREANPDDRRGLFAVVTAAGLKMFHEAEPFHIQGVREKVFDILTKRELNTVAAASTKVLNHLDDTT